MAAEPVRIGVYNTRAVALGFYRSPAWQKELRAKMVELDAAKRAGNAKAVEELEKWGKAQQDLAHKQVFGESPITNVLERIAPVLARVSKESELAGIAAAVAYTAPGVSTIEVTMRIVEGLEPDEKTRTMVRQFLDNPPPAGEASHSH
jgi:hypothetical protein